MAAAAAARQGAEKNWMVWTFWAAGVALLLVEVNAGMEYWEASLQHNMGSLLGWVPAVGLITVKAAEQAVWHWGTLALLLKAIPVAAVGLMLVGLSLGIKK